MTKKLTSRKTMDAHREHMWRLWKFRAAIWALFWAVVAHGLLVLGIAIVGGAR